MFNDFEKIKKQLSNYLKSISLEKNKKFKPLEDSIKETSTKLDKKSEKINDDNRYLIQNALVDFKQTTGKLNLSYVEKDWMINNKIFVECEKDNDDKFFQYKKHNYALNFGIKPKISNLFNEYKNSMGPLNNFIDYLEKNYKHECEISSEYGSDVSYQMDDFERGFIFWGYETGGASGGNCWGDDATSYHVEEKPKKEFPVLKQVLRDIVPEISFLDFEELKEVIKDDVFTEREYYGNYTDYYYEYINPLDLFKKLNELGYDVESKFKKESPKASSKISKENKI